MKFFDISMPLHEKMVVWPAGQPARRSLGKGGEKFNRKELKSGEAIISLLEMSSHTGTHVDAPKHFIKGGKSIERILLNKLIGPCRVIEVRPLPPSVPSPGLGRERERSNPGQLIKVSDLVKFKIGPHDKILFKTRNSKLLRLKKFTSNYVSLSLGAAVYLVKKKIALVGIDYLGIEAKGSPGHPVHKTLLRAGIVIVEGLDLSKIKPGKYNLAVLPLKIMAGDGAPARAILWKS